MKKNGTDILIVDDQSGVRILLATAFEERGYKVAVAVNGKDGVDKAKKLKPGLIMMDIKMPVLDGVTALYKIKENNKNQKVIMMSAYGDAQTIEKIKKTGALFIAKPFDLKCVLDYVDSILKAGDLESLA